MKRIFLENMGLEKEQVDSIMAENGKDIEAAKADKAGFEKEIENLKGQLTDRDKQLEKLRSSAGDVEEMKKQIEALQAENKAANEAHQAEMRSLKIDAAVEKALTGAKARNNTAVRALLKDLDKAEFDSDGLIKGLSDQIKELQKDEGTKFLFDLETDKKGAQMKGVTPAAAGDGKPKANTSDMTYSEMVDYLEANPGAKII